MPPKVITYQRAAWMRRRLTPPEARLWGCLKGGKLKGFKFRRQHPIDRYILDFYCLAARVAIEVDGAVHDTAQQSAHDARRTEWLQTQGIRVLRYPATAIRDNLEGVLAHILKEVSGR